MATTTTNTISKSTIPCSFGHGTLRICRRGTNKSIVLVALDRPKQYNAFDDTVYEDLTSILLLTKADNTVSAIVLTGVGSYFSSGANLKNGNFEPEPVPGRQTVLTKPVGQFMYTLISYPKLLAAAVNGPAVGIGVTLLMHCDIVHCTTTATFWLPFTRLALVPELCSSITFTETFGLSKANELLVLGKKINAQTAYEWNLCSKVITNYDTTGDPFIPTNSIGNLLCTDIDQSILQLPVGHRTVTYFVELIKGSRRQRMEHICRIELDKLDERFDSGQVSIAAQQLKIGNKKRPPTNKHQNQQREETDRRLQGTFQPVSKI
jgi:enoyl-CoA hydratase/carnithine racemase